MKKRVELSTYCVIMSIVSTCVLSGMFWYSITKTDNTLAVILWGGAVTLLYLSAMFYMPLSITLSDKALRINRPLWAKDLLLSDIAYVSLTQPTIGARRICGSGGWFGFYGRFRENDLGEYFAYYGKASDCFLVTLKSGKKYMLGCTDAAEMVNAIKDRL